MVASEIFEAMMGSIWRKIHAAERETGKKTNVRFYSAAVFDASKCMHQMNIRNIYPNYLAMES